jgi:hypothetical protein
MRSSTFDLRAIYRQLHAAAFSISSAASARCVDHRDVARRDLNRVRAHPLPKLPLGVGGYGLVVLGERYEDGSDFQAGTPITSSKADNASAC